MNILLYGYIIFTLFFAFPINILMFVTVSFDIVFKMRIFSFICNFNSLMFININYNIIFINIVFQYLE